MRKGILLTLVLGLLAVGQAPAATRNADVKAVTVGSFATQIAASLGQEAHDMQAVRSSLRALGVTADFEPDAALTAGMASRIAGELGVRTSSPSNPSAVLGPAPASAVVGLISTTFIEARVSTLSDPPVQCLSSVNRGACVNCCKTATGLTGKFCGRFCHANVPPPPSPEEPQP